MELLAIALDTPPDTNAILGQSHFIKSVEDIHEALVNAVPDIEFGLAFCEASGPCLVRISGNAPDLVERAAAKALELGAGHVFLIFLRKAFPINVMAALRAVPEVCTIYCASANPVQVLLAETKQGRGVLGVIDGAGPKGIETEQDIADRQALLRRFGYKL
jgi:adenosine/AMP kinase